MVFAGAGRVGPRRIPWVLLRMARACSITLVGIACGCIVGVNHDDDVDPCRGVVCSEDASCEAGQCHCDEGYVGDANALAGCFPTQPPIPPSSEGCEGGCGALAECNDGVCRCQSGTAAVCGTADCLALDRICDGESDCADGFDESPAGCRASVQQDWFIVDACDDGLDMRWRLWSFDRPWVWPATGSFTTPGFDVDALAAIECAEGETVCFGAEAGSLSWGVGLDGTLDCEDCCASCSSDAVDIGFLTCD